MMNYESRLLAQTLSAGSGLNAGSCGAAATAPQISVARMYFNSAARPSVPSADTAVTGYSYCPSGKAKRKRNLFPGECDGGIGFGRAINNQLGVDIEPKIFLARAAEE